MSNSPELQESFSLEEAEKWLNGHFLRHPAVIAFIYIEKDKNHLTVGSSGKKNSGTRKDRSYYKAVLVDKVGDFYISEPLISRTTGLPAVVMVHTVKDKSGKVKGIIGLSVSIEKLSNFVSKISEINKKTQNIHHLWVIDKTGLIISDTRDSAQKKINITKGDEAGYQGLNNLSSAILKNNKGYSRIKTNEGKKIIASWNSIPNTSNWKLGLFIPANPIDMQRKKIILQISVLMIVSLILLAVILSVVIRSQMLPISKSLSLAKIIAKLDLTRKIEEKVLQSQDELGELARAMNEMSVRLRLIIHDIRLAGDYVLTSSGKLDDASKIIPDSP